MSAERLRAAATLMRERAKAATPGPWDLVRDRIVRHEAEVDVVIAADAFPGFSGTGFAETATHIASWPPAVALVVADLLEHAANNWSLFRTSRMADRLLATADAYLGSLNA